MNNLVARSFQVLVGLSLVASVVACASSATPIGTDPSPIGGDDGGPTPSRSDSGTDAGAKTDAAPQPEPAECPISFTSSSCQSCFASKCGADCGACAGDAACDSALTCVASCSDSACVNACVSGLSTKSRALFDDVLGSNGCVETTCAAACKTSTPGRVGDACTTDSQCANDNCGGAWCASTCTSNINCGINTEGDLVWCVPSSAGTNQCFPGCTSNSDCSQYGSGFTCQSATATNGSTARICSR